MAKKTPQQKGFDFEADWAALFGTEPVPGSGNQWYVNLDVGDGNILWSLKHTDKDRFVIDQALIAEAIEACFGPLGKGAQPGWAFSLLGKRFVMLEADTLMGFITKEVEPYREPTKRDIKRARAGMNRLVIQGSEEENA